MNTTTRLLLSLPLLWIASCSDAADAKNSQAASMESGKQTDDARPVDALITERVRYALQQETATANELGGVGISTVEGIVTLTGNVSSAAVRDRFNVVTKAVGSVTRVDNQLAVKGG